MYQNSKLKSEVQNSYGFENELDKLVSSLDDKKSRISLNMLFQGPRGILAWTSRNGEC